MALTLRVDLLAGLGQAAVIVEVPTGVEYVQQCGGYACSCRSAVGFLVPIGGGFLYEALSKFFGPDGYWNGCCNEPIDKVTTDMIDELLDGTAMVGLSVDVARLEESEESWIPLLLDEDACEYFHIETPRPCPAILTWPNSD